ncbi:hypothetical protein M8Z33_02910 [Streptomyces sp. ZAF1911]|uniref:hypothetical protein n=1 Tax=Streptomyces sp. ZAF1911 TaxID=2944129 RepID=UPI00237A0CD9|nr:hypothetical protein [Streptomyces sp. ZAF1911]MDD9375640.1 hypothetical protein [Streptomyces sp. ZAF1911]
MSTGTGRQGPVREDRRAVPAPIIGEFEGPAVPGWIAMVVGCVYAACAGALVRAAGTVGGSGLEEEAPKLLDAGPAHWALTGLQAVICLIAIGALARGRKGKAWTLSLFGRYRGTVHAIHSARPVGIECAGRGGTA